jgi:TPR repeat protein
MFNLALCCGRGRGVAKDDAEAARLSRAAACARSAGWLHACAGRGVRAGPAEAMRWLAVAAERGCGAAMRTIALMRAQRRSRVVSEGGGEGRPAGVAFLAEMHERGASRAGLAEAARACC